MKFVPYVCCGDPSIDFSFKLVQTLAPYSDVIELGIPFSDPIADGKTIQAAANRALKNGVNVEKVFAMVEKLRASNVSTPFVFMTYYNIVFAYGAKKFLQKMKSTGVQGLIVPDLPFGEDAEFEQLAESEGISLVYLIAQNTSEKRAKRILSSEKLFTYLVSVAGITGARNSVSSTSIDFVKRIRSLAGKENNLLVGFGVSSVSQANEFVQAGANGVVVGSKIIDLYQEKQEQNALSEIKLFAESFKK